jgi:hypothetical protein
MTDELFVRKERPHAVRRDYFEMHRPLARKSQRGIASKNPLLRPGAAREGIGFDISDGSSKWIGKRDGVES